jgi:hypothetical protein
MAAKKRRAKRSTKSRKRRTKKGPTILKLEKRVAYLEKRTGIKRAKHGTRHKRVMSFVAGPPMP